MDYLDPKKRRAHTFRLMVGYALVSIAILFGTLILFYVAKYGFGLNEGKIVQNGLAFISSHPGGSSLYVDGKSKGTTSARLTLEAGSYAVQIQRPGYRTWQRAITVEGGSVERFDYPFLFPNKLITKTVATYTINPELATQSLDRRWLLIERPAQFGNFDLYDLSSPQKAAVNESLPTGLLTIATGAQSLSIVQWSNDSRHVLLKHTYNGTYEYILVDRQDTTKSLNLTKTLGLSATATLTLQNEQYDHYFVYDAKTTVLGTATLGSTSIIPLLQYVVSFKTYGSNVVLYTTNQNVPANKTQVMLYQDGTNYPIRIIARDTTYLLDLTQYSGSWYVAAGAQSEGSVYVYQDPVSILQNQPKTVLVPVDVLKVNTPTHLAFSSSAQFIMTENANSFSVYDVQYNRDYTYTIKAGFDAPQEHATWMDGDRLTYVSGGSLIVFDYDSANLQKLQPASSSFVPFFDPNYKVVYAFGGQAATAKTAAVPMLTSTSLLVPPDK